MFTTSACAVSSGGGSSGSSGGSGGGSSSNPTPIAINTVIVPLIKITVTASVGSASPVVTILQKFLNSHGYPVATKGAGSSGQETQTFGPATKAALIKFQTAQGIKTNLGTLDTKTIEKINTIANVAAPATPTTPVGTAALIASLQQQLNSLIAQLAILMGNKTTPTSTVTPVTTPVSSNLLFPTNLWVNMQSPEVKRLQLWLNSHNFVIAESGPGSVGNESDRFGNATIAALKKFQASGGVPQTGGLDGATRAVME